MVKIVICGAGISGLSAYLLLQKHLNGSSSSPHEIKIYEAYDIRKPSFKNNDAAAGTSNTPTAPSQDLSADEAIPTPQTIGGGIGISKNGLNVLSRMENSDNKSFSTHGEHDETSGTGVNSGLIKEMTRRGHPIERWEISTARGWTIVDVNLIPRHLRDPGTNSDDGDSSARRGSSVAKQDRYMYHSVMIARQACWEILRDRVLDHSPDAVVTKRIVGVVIGDAATSNTIKFEDGTEDSADLVIGADGLRSVVRKAMFETDKINAHSADVHQSGHLNQGWAQAVLRWLGLSSKSGEKENSTGCDYITPHYE
jgi:2-polyprenyl-6-methoxyphenol hydroxylase-like FAD-dependent oxidoreductase